MASILSLPQCRRCKQKYPSPSERQMHLSMIWTIIPAKAVHGLVSPTHLYKSYLNLAGSWHSLWIIVDSPWYWNRLEMTFCVNSVWMENMYPGNWQKCFLNAPIIFFLMKWERKEIRISLKKTIILYCYVFCLWGKRGGSNKSASWDEFVENADEYVNSLRTSDAYMRW